MPDMEFHPLKSMRDLPVIRSRESYQYASQKFESIVNEIREFETGLDDDHEVGLQLASFGSSLTMIVTDIGYQDPDLMYFWGTVNGRPAELIQHMNQLNFLIIAVDKEEPEQPARRIGFVLAEEAQGKAAGNTPEKASGNTSGTPEKSSK
jgi:hypothetical protein